MGSAQNGALTEQGIRRWMKQASMPWRKPKLDRLERLLDACTADIDYEVKPGRIVEIEFENGSKIIVNRHSAAGRSGWRPSQVGFHFRAGRGRWVGTRTAPISMPCCPVACPSRRGGDQSGGLISPAGFRACEAIGQCVRSIRRHSVGACRWLAQGFSVGVPAGSGGNFRRRAGGSPGRSFPRRGCLQAECGSGPGLGACG